MSLAHLLLRQACETPARAGHLRRHQRPRHAWRVGRAQRRAGRRLREAGLVPGDRVLLFMRNHPRYLEMLWAAWWAGLVVVPVNAKLHPREAEWIVADAQARWAFVTRDVAPGRWPAWSGRSMSNPTRPTPCWRRRRRRWPCRSAERDAGRRGLAVLHQRHHRPPQGRDDHAPQPDDDGPGLLRRCRCRVAPTTRSSMRRRCRTAPASTRSRT